MIASHLICIWYRSSPTMSRRYQSAIFLPGTYQSNPDRSLGAFASERGVPVDLFEKDTDLIKSQLRNVTYRGTSGVQVKGPPAAFESRVEFEEPQVATDDSDERP